MINTQDEIEYVMEVYRQFHRRVVFTNGCFDILHVGHIKCLREASKLGDFLIVGLNSDSSIKEIKGQKRPIINQDHRAEILSSLKYVDHVVIFNEKTPKKLIEKIKPDFLVKGSDWSPKKIEDKTIRIPIVKGISTTKIIKKIQKRAL